MLLRSSSTPFLHPFLSSSSSSSSMSPSSPSCIRLRRAVSDSHLPALHASSSDDHHSNTTDKATTLHTELSFSIYNNTSDNSPPHQEQGQEHKNHHQQKHQHQEQQQVPLFLARGLGIDRIASGLFTAGTKAGVYTGPAGAAKMDGFAEQDEKMIELDAQYRKMVDEQPSNALFLRNYAQFLHQVKGDPRRAEEYYSRAMLADPGDGEIMSQYAKLVWEEHRDQDRSLSYFQKSVQAAPQNSYVLAAYASFLWELDGDLGEGEEEDLAGDLEHAAGPVQLRELASATV